VVTDHGDADDMDEWGNFCHLRLMLGKRVDALEWLEPACALPIREKLVAM
jgi:hypothetical protein